MIEPDISEIIMTEPDISEVNVHDKSNKAHMLDRVNLYLSAKIHMRQAE